MKKTIYSNLLVVICLLPNFSNAQTITSFSPTSGPVGTTVTITGTGFNTTPASNIVFFGATMATVSAATAISLTVTVPSGANFQYITVTNLNTYLTAYSAQPFNMATSCSSTPSFAAAISVQGGSHNVETCDMDGDGKADLVIADYFNNTFTVTRNTSTPGSISFAPKVTFPWAAAGQPNEVSIGDFDGDGKPDVALGGNGGGAFVSVYRNTSTPGSISFAARQDFSASSGQGNGNKIIDIDKDGKPDLVSVHWSGNCVWVLRNTSTGPGIISFAAGVSFATTTQPHKIDVGDLDGDSKPDVVITAFTSNTLSIFRNTSTPGTISFAARQDFSPGTVPYFIHIGDLDGDGKADIATVTRDASTLAVYRNTSTPGAITLAVRQDFATLGGAFTHYGLDFGDLDGDGKPDIAVGNSSLNSTSIFRNTSVPGTISFAARVDVASGYAYFIGIDDFDGDGKPDIAVTKSGTTVSILGNLCALIPSPVELLSFTGEQRGEEVLLQWSTASEINNDYFDVENSVDGKAFEKIGRVAGHGNTNQLLNYSFIDEYPYSGINYYRLKQVDYNGDYNYSPIIAVKNNLAGNPCFVYNDETSGNFILSCAKSENYQVRILSVEGKILKAIKIKVDTGNKIDLHDFSNGMYILRIIDGENIQNLKLIKN
ncbi:MAG: T9SS type A sorting domain-containing protein [Bacteroidetes bacterium]|nr:T9SS type A sorting domain-containing protein [Bacteroidota bacterium]